MDQNFARQQLQSLASDAGHHSLGSFSGGLEMKTTFTLMLVGIVISSCSRNSENRIVYPDGHPIPTAPQRIVIRSSDVSAESQRRTGPTPLLLGPEALHEVYKGVFADRLSDTNTFLFGPEESDELGGFRILKPSNPRW